MINHQATYDGADGHSGQHQDREEVARPSAPRSSEDRADGPDDQEPREPCILRLEADAGNIASEEASAKQGYSQSDVAPRDGRHQARVSMSWSERDTVRRSRRYGVPHFTNQ